MDRKARWVMAGLAALISGGLAVIVVQRDNLPPLFRASEPPHPNAAPITRPVERSPPLPGNDSSVSAEPLRLILVATERRSRAADSTAKIGTDERNPQTYRIGAILANGARLAEIGDDFVLLERGGKTHRLARGVVANAKVPAAGSIDSVGGDAPEKVAAAPESEESVTDAIRPRPIYDDAGSLIAYELHPGRNVAAFTRVGLMSGDRLIAVNGAALASTGDAADALRLLSAGASVEATIVRNGTTLQSTLHGADLSADGTAPAGR
jgi:general secretion pathway protein C